MSSSEESGAAKVLAELVGARPDPPWPGDDDAAAWNVAYAYAALDALKGLGEGQGEVADTLMCLLLHSVGRALRQAPPEQ